MRRTAIIALLLLAALGGAAALSEAAGPGAARSQAWVRVKSCSLEQRSAVFHARMRRIRGARRMGLRFTLLERSQGARRFRKVRAPGLARWRKSKVGVRTFGHRQRVEELVEGHAYKVLVRYRWYDRAGRRIRSARRTSRACRQFESLPNLRARLLGRRRIGSGAWRYSVTVANRGSAAAFDVPVRLSVDGGSVDTQTVDRLGRGESKVLRFPGPACSNSVSVVADPNGVLKETNEADNGETVLCGVLG